MSLKDITNGKFQLNISKIHLPAWYKKASNMACEYYNITPKQFNFKTFFCKFPNKLPRHLSFSWLGNVPNLQLEQ